MSWFQKPAVRDVGPPAPTAYLAAQVACRLRQDLRLIQQPPLPPKRPADAAVLADLLGSAREWFRLLFPPWVVGSAKFPLPQAPGRATTLRLVCPLPATRAPSRRDVHAP